MYFEVNITPKEKASAVQVDPETKFSLLLAPFQPLTHMRIETALYTTAQCYLSLRNPSNRSLNVHVTKIPPAERAVALNLSELKIGPEGEEELVVSWTARQPGTFRDIIQLTDSRRIKYNIALTTSTISSKKNGHSNVRSKGFDQPQTIGAKKKVLKHNTSPKNRPESKRNLSENVLEELNTPNKRHKTSYASKYQGKENISNNTDVGWQTPSKRSAGILGVRRDKLSDVSSAKSSDFSVLIESDKFSLTPHSWFKNETIKQENASPDFMQFTSQNYAAMLSSPETGLRVLRRETYLTTPLFQNATFTNKDSRDHFEDSLSPPEQKPRPNSDFSMLIDDLNFAANTPVAAPEPTNVESNFFTPTPDRNNTFEVIKSSEVEESCRITTRHSVSSSEIDRLVPTRLARTFARLSPVMPVVEPSAIKFATSSSPICGNDAAQIAAGFKFNVEGTASASRQSDASSAREVLEADLWAKPMNQCPLPVLRSRPTSLECIQEESLKLTPITNKTYVKCSNETQTSNASSSAANRRFEFSPPTVNKARKTSPIRKISPKKYSKVSKDKSVQELQGLKRKAAMNTSLKSKGERFHSIPGVRIAKLSLAGLTAKKGNGGPGRTSEPEVSTKLHDSEHFFTILCNPDPFAATTTEDPFLASTLYFDNKWVENQEVEFKKWLNTLLTPPEHLTSNVDTPLIDVAKVWQTCRSKEDVSLAETKEAVSARYHTNQRLDTLRRAACTMLRSNEVVSVLSRVTVCVEKGILVIRQDRDLHKDIGLQKLVLELLLCYNPLWLRIGLEAIYGETIPLNSNNDIIRLSKFLLGRFFSDPYLVSTHSHQTVHNLRLPSFFALMNKFMLKKFLFIIFFLDYAKTRKLIGHDPCLFHKQAIYKESRRILLKFSQELLSGVGDVTRVLKPYGYVLTHRQTELDEYSYAVDSLSLDLRDGVRLCRVMELITGKRNLTSVCRVPAISRLQKVYNVDVALKALASSGYTVRGNITAKCIADGHRERTLSLLWQIIYKFQAPHFNKAAATIQRWWSSKVWWLRVRNFLRRRKSDAACVIQRAWRTYLARKELTRLRVNRAQILAVENNAARVIQVKWIAMTKMMKEKKAFQERKAAAVTVQNSWRNYRATKPFVESLNRKRSAALAIQRRWRATKSMRLQLSAYLILTDATIRIQNWWRVQLAQKAARERDREITRAVIYIQNTWRANRSMKIERREYLRKTNAVKTIQNWWRGELLCRNERCNFLLMKSSAIIIQRTFRAWERGSSLRKWFLTLRSNVIFAQRKWRAKKLAQPLREDFLTKRKAAVRMQTWWRGLLLAKRIKTEYDALRSAAIVIQRMYRARKSTVYTREEFLLLKTSVICVQRRWRARKFMLDCKASFVETRRTVVKIQVWWRACLEAKEARTHYETLRTATILIQRKYRAVKAGALVRQDFRTLRTSVIRLQQRWRAKKLAEPIRQDFLRKRKAAIGIQAWWRAKKTEKYYQALRSAVILVQQKYRARKLAVVSREEFLSLKTNVTCIQRRWRANKSMREYRESFLATRKTTVKIQVWWRACLEAKEAKVYYEKLKTTTILIQRKYRALRVGGLVREEFRTLRISVIRMQRKWRAKKLMQPIREDFLTRRKATVEIQAWWRAKRAETNYKTLKFATVLIQRKYRAQKLAVSTREEFLTLRRSVVGIQQRWRANRSMKLEREHFLAKRRTALKIQHRWRAAKLGRVCRENYEKQKSAAVQIQRWYRSYVEARSARENDIGTVRSLVKIQRWWREILTNRRRITERRASAATLIQAVWRAHKVRRLHTEETSKLRERSERAAVEAKTSATLGLRLNAAIVMFQEYGNLGRLTQGLTALDTITHLLPHTSAALCNANLVGSLYNVLHRTNRSRPWMDICLRASSILVTIAKYAPTKQYAWQEEHIETIVHLMSATLERETNVFLHLATLLWLLADSPARIKAIAESPTTIWLLSCMHNTVSKKKTRLSVGSKQSSAVTGSLLPNPKPDWGLKHSRPRLFTSVHHAVYTLCKKIQVKHAQS